MSVSGRVTVFGLSVLTSTKLSRDHVEHKNDQVKGADGAVQCESVPCTRVRPAVLRRGKTRRAKPRPTIARRALIARTTQHHGTETATQREGSKRWPGHLVRRMGTLG